MLARVLFSSSPSPSSSSSTMTHCFRYLTVWFGKIRSRVCLLEMGSNSDEAFISFPTWQMTNTSQGLREAEVEYWEESRVTRTKGSRRLWSWAERRLTWMSEGASQSSVWGAELGEDGSHQGRVGQPRGTCRELCSSLDRAFFEGFLLSLLLFYLYAGHTKDTNVRQIKWQ